MTRDQHLRAIYIVSSQQRGKKQGLIMLCSGSDYHGAEMFVPGITAGLVLKVANRHINEVDETSPGTVATDAR